MDRTFLALSAVTTPILFAWLLYYRGYDFNLAAVLIVTMAIALVGPLRPASGPRPRFLVPAFSIGSAHLSSDQHHTSANLVGPAAPVRTGTPHRLSNVGRC